MTTAGTTPAGTAGGDPIPAIREQDATGETAALYADLRATLGVPVVNLVWRHIAMEPGALAWAWGAVRPIYADGTIAAEADAVRGKLALPDLPKAPPSLLGALGFDAAAQASIQAVLASYDRSNTMNLIGLSTLVHVLEGRAPAAGEAVPGTPGAALEAPLPKLLAASEMAPAAADLVSRLNMLGETDGGRIVASMYRHLSHWPAFLAFAWTLVAPLDADGRLAAAIEANRAAARARAAVLSARLAPLPPLPEASARYVRDALVTFTEHPIGKMVTICRIIRRALSD